MLKSKANWHFKRDEALDEQDIIEYILADRGVTKEEREAFLQPDLDDLTDPAKLNDIEHVKKRLFKAIENGEKVAVFGDYDADGVTATALMVKVLERMNVNCLYYIPNRFSEGYGMNIEAINTLHELDVSLIITVDNGIANVLEVEHANSLGIDVIITDHHEIQDELPEAYAIVHPKLSTDYPFKELAGVGVAFQVATYLLEKAPSELLDFVAIGTIADLVPLIGENRTFVKLGLETLNKTKNIGLKALIKYARLNELLDARDVGFMIAPRINAVGRLQDASLAVELLLCDDEQVATEIAEEIEALNVERQQIVAKIVEEAEQMVDEEDDFILLYEENWHEGVLGICASRLVQTFHRPIMLLTWNESTKQWKGSARSIASFNLFEACNKERKLFVAFGGHAQAAGMTVEDDNIDVLKERLNQLAEEHFMCNDMKETIEIDCRLPLEKATETLVKKVQSLEPFGNAHEEPVFHIQGILSDVRQIGQEKQHLKMLIQDERENKLEAIGFQFGHLYYGLSQNVQIEIVGTLQVNEWNGNRKVQLLMKDLKVDEWQLFDYRGRKEIEAMQHCANLYERFLIVCRDESETELKSKFAKQSHGSLITYEDVTFEQKSAELLFIYDMPTQIEQLTKIIRTVRPEAIFVNYMNVDNAYLYQPPGREQFKKLYAYLYKYERVQIYDFIRTMIERMKWSKDQVIFMLQVFFDLGFIERKDDKIVLKEVPEKRPLTESKTYQQRLERGNIEKLLYFSTYDELKRTFENWRQWQNAGEEVTYGL